MRSSGIRLATECEAAGLNAFDRKPEFGNLRDKVKHQGERIASLESYVLDLNARICALEAEGGGPDPAEGCPGWMQARVSLNR